MPESMTATEKSQENHNPNTIEVFISYNGVERSFEANINEPVHVLLGKAVREFGITNQPHVLSLFTQANVELADAAKIGDAGVKNGDHLLLRPSTVKGG